MRKQLIIGFIGLLFVGLALGLLSLTRNTRNKNDSSLHSSPISYQSNYAHLKLLNSPNAIARIGSVELTSQDLKDQLKNSATNPEEYHSLSEAGLSAKVQETFDELVEDELLAQEALHRGIDSVSTDNERRRVLAVTLIQDEASRQPPITDVEERDFYKNHGEKFTLAPSNQVREIFIPFTSKDDLNLKTGPTYQKANSLAERIRSGESMDSLARKYAPKSMEKAAGYEFTGAVMDEKDAATVLNLNPGVIAGPFRVEGGLSIFQGISRIPQRFIPFYKAQPTIYRYLEEQRILRIRRKLIEQLSQKILVRKIEPSTGKL